MDPKLLTYYNRELQHLREVSGEFASEFPKVAGRLGLDSFECADPYVERLLEGFAFIASRVHLKLDSEFDRFTQHLLQMVYPHYLSPTPSMAVVQFALDLTEGSLAEGFTIPRNSSLRSRLAKGQQTNCEYRTAHDVTLWPINIKHAEYFTREGVLVNIPRIPGVKAGFRIVLESTAGLNFEEIDLDSLTFYLRGHGEQPTHIYELLLANAVSIVVRPAGGSPDWEHVLDPSSVGRVGFSEEEAMLPYGCRSFHGYRLLEEYFALPQRFQFIKLSNLADSVQRCAGNQLEVLILLDTHDPYLENQVDDVDFALYCTPIVNLFPKRADRIHLNNRKSEYQVIADRTRPVDYEIYDVVLATGYGSDSKEVSFQPFYASHNRTAESNSHAYFSLNRRRRKMPARSGATGPRSSYIGSEVFLSLVDSSHQPYDADLQQLGMETLCTNRDLPLYMPVGIGDSDFSIQSNAPVKAVYCLAGPTKPRPSRSEGGGKVSWQLINHLSLNYLSLLNDENSHGASALRALLRLYGDSSEPAIGKQVDGVRSVSAKPITRPLQHRGPIAFVRGLEITISLDDSAFEGTGIFVLGAVLEEFFAKYVSLNSFTETVIQSVDRGDVIRWPARIGRRQIM